MIAGVVELHFLSWIYALCFQGYRLQEENFGLDTNDDGIEKDKIDETDDDETKAVKTKSDINAEEYQGTIGQH